jgi:hypothetical protein
VPSVAIDPIAVDAPKTAHHVHPTAAHSIVDLNVELWSAVLSVHRRRRREVGS